MNKSLDQLLSRFDGKAFARDVEEELQFHIAMQARDYEKQGLTPEESLARAELRFGNFAEIKVRCIRIASQNSASMRAMKILFAVAFCLGVLIRVFSPEYHLTRVGDLLIMIAVSGGLLVFAKRFGATDFRTEGKPLRLGLRDGSESMPVSFDEKGRTPFERVRGDDR